MRQIVRRLQTLERVAHRRPLLGMRIYSQGIDDPDTYYLSVGGQQRGEPCTRAEIDALSAAGWQCLVICYKTDDPEALWLTWGEGEPEPES